MTKIHRSWNGVDNQGVMGGQTLPILPDVLMLRFLETTKRKTWWLFDESVVYIYERLYTQKAFFVYLPSMGRIVSSDLESQRYPTCHVRNPIYYLTRPSRLPLKEEDRRWITD